MPGVVHTCSHFSSITLEVLLILPFIMLMLAVATIAGGSATARITGVFTVDGAAGAAGVVEAAVSFASAVAAEIVSVAGIARVLAVAVAEVTRVSRIEGAVTVAGGGKLVFF